MSIKRSINTRKRQRRLYLKSTIDKPGKITSLPSFKSRRKSLTRQSLLRRLSLHEESLPFVKPKIGSPLENRPHLNFPFRRTRSSTRFCRKRDGSRYFLGTLGWNPNSCPKTSGWRHCKSLIFLDSHWTWHKPYCSKSNALNSIYMSAHTTSIN